ncbi:hypothetical protein [Arenibaculum pallidiluteum]|uniref:hypothetical protein n=1 Tax=Arenibaculum pallidiluteum TaxID=2812559 RepID=UPI001A96E34E|nr:hypothetical protein [Arenibaculum pallidiluteum]
MDKLPFENPESGTERDPAPWGRTSTKPPPRQTTEPPADEPVRFYALRDSRLAWSGVAMIALLLSPLVFFAPDLFIVSVLANAAMALLQDRLFRFELTDSTLHLRLGLLARGRRLHLGDVVEAETLTLQGLPAGPAQARGASRPAAGHLRLRLRNGEEILVPGLADPAEAAEAIRLLRDGRAHDAA